MERVWDYPRPPAVEPVVGTVRVELAGEVLAESSARAARAGDQPSADHLRPAAGPAPQWLRDSSARGSFCEFKGRRSTRRRRRRPPRAEIGWFYPEPTAGYEQLRGFVAFYPGRVDAAWIGDERVQAQDGDFYGGWITADLIGPFKGPPGTLGW